MQLLSKLMFISPSDKGRVDDGGYYRGFCCQRFLNYMTNSIHDIDYSRFQKRVVFINLYIYVFLTGCRRWCCDVV